MYGRQQSESLYLIPYDQLKLMIYLYFDPLRENVVVFLRYTNFTLHMLCTAPLYSPINSNDL